MNGKTKNFLMGAAVLATFAAYFFLSLSCATPPKETFFYAYQTENTEDDYDITLVSEKNTISKVYKLVAKKDSKVYYSISAPYSATGATTVTANVTSADLISYALISEEDAKQAVAFISDVEKTFTKKRANADGVLNEFKVWRNKTESVWVPEAQKFQSIEVRVPVFEITLQTTKGDDEIFYTINNGTPTKTDVAKLKALQAVLSK